MLNINKRKCERHILETKCKQLVNINTAEKRDKLLF